MHFFPFSSCVRLNSNKLCVPDLDAGHCTLYIAPFQHRHIACENNIKKNKIENLMHICFDEIRSIHEFKQRMKNKINIQSNISILKMAFYVIPQSLTHAIHLYTKISTLNIITIQFLFIHFEVSVVFFCNCVNMPCRTFVLPTIVSSCFVLCVLFSSLSSYFFFLYKWNNLRTICRRRHRHFFQFFSS